MISSSNEHKQGWKKYYWDGQQFVETAVSTDKPRQFSKSYLYSKLLWKKALPKEERENQLARQRLVFGQSNEEVSRFCKIGDNFGCSCDWPWNIFSKPKTKHSVTLIRGHWNESTVRFVLWNLHVSHTNNQSRCKKFVGFKCKENLSQTIMLIA